MRHRLVSAIVTVMNDNDKSKMVDKLKNMAAKERRTLDTFAAVVAENPLLALSESVDHYVQAAASYRALSRAAAIVENAPDMSVAIWRVVQEALAMARDYSRSTSATTNLARTAAAAAMAKAADVLGAWRQPENQAQL